MAKKIFGLGTASIIGSIAVGAAAGVFYYFKRAEIKKLAEDIMSRVARRECVDSDDFTDFNDIRQWEPPVDTAEMNIVNSGISLESVETSAEAEPQSGAEDEAVPAPEAEGTGDAAEPEAPEAEPEDEADAEQPKKKTWFWSK